jgi:hypothetical protein
MKNQIMLNLIIVYLMSSFDIIVPIQRETDENYRVNPGYEFVGRTTKAVIVTRGMMRYLHSTCVSTLILAENGIVDFEPKSILFHNYPHCFENIVLNGNRFSYNVRGFRKFVSTTRIAVHLLK